MVYRAASGGVGDGRNDKCRRGAVRGKRATAKDSEPWNGVWGATISLVTARQAGESAASGDQLSVFRTECRRQQERVVPDGSKRKQRPSTRGAGATAASACHCRGHP